MILNRTISLLAMSAVIAAFASPAFAQHRDNQTETRPTIETKGGGGETDHDVQVERPLPRSSKGMICRVGEARNGVAYVSLVNDTGAVIPAGSTLTVYVQPGNVQKLYKVDKDWKPGQKLDLPLKGVVLAEDAACSVRVKLAEPTPVPDVPQEEEPDQPVGGDEPQGGFENPFPGSTITGDTGPLGDDPSKLVSAACVILPGGRVDFINTGNVAWPSGSYFEVTLPNGQVYTIWGTGFAPGGTAQIPDELLYYPGSKPDAAPYLPADWTCKITMHYQPEDLVPFITGDTGHLGAPGEPLLSAACLVYPAGGAILTNNGAADWPAGTHLTVALPNGQVFETTLDTDIGQNNGVGIPAALVYYPDLVPEPGTFLPDDWTCQIEVEFPEGGN